MRTRCQRRWLTAHGSAAWRAALGLLLPLVLGACSATARPNDPRVAGDAAVEEPELRVMVTFPSTSPFVVRESIKDLSFYHQLQVVASWVMESLDQQCVVFEVPTRVASRPEALERLVDLLSKDHRVELAQRVQRFTAQSSPSAELPTDGLRGSYRRFQHAADLLRLDAVHEVATGAGVRVAVIDTGMDTRHPDYGARVVEARDFVIRDEESGFTSDLHGTAVAGLIASDHQDEQGIDGVAPGAELLALRACWPESAGGRRAVCDSYTLALALDHAITSEVRVINLSLGGPDDPILRRLVEAGLARDIVVVAANGGEGADFPAIVPGVLDVRSLPLEGAEVGSLDRGQPASSPGDWLAAPGHEILTTAPGGYEFWDGASMAAAQVSGVAALILQHRPDLTPGELGGVLRATSRDNPGHALVDPCAALARATGRDCPSADPPP